MIAHFITSTGTISAIHPFNGIHFTPEEMQRKVGGEFELLLTDEKHTMIVNKEADIKRLPLNIEATKLVPEIKIYGDVIVCEWS